MEVTKTDREGPGSTAVVAAESGEEMPEVDPKQPDSDMHQIRCPICEETFTPQGMSGHLRFGHHKTGEEFQELMEAARSGERIEMEQSPKKAESEGEGSKTEGARGRSVPPRPEKTGGPVSQQEGDSEGFDWKARLSRMEGLRRKMKGLDRSKDFFGFNVTRDEGCAEAVEALDEIEMEVREQIGASQQDRELREAVDESLDQMEALVQCREQREAIKERFSGEKADRRVERLDEREAEIRAHVREEWGVGKPTEDLHDSDPVADIESSVSEEGEEDSGSGGALSKLVNG